MKQLHLRRQPSVADPLGQERLRRARAIIMDYQEEDPARLPCPPECPPQSTTGRNDCQSDPIPPSRYPSAGLEPVTHP
jgi:hypothetical protein